MRSWIAWKTSDAAVTIKFYRDLDQHGPIGLLAHALFKAQKASHRAKRYRGGNGVKSYRDLSYERKQSSIRELCQILTKHSSELGISWGWGLDTNADHVNKWVIYVVIQQGQVSFHSPDRHEGPDFGRQWDGKHVSTERVLAFCEQVLADKKSDRQLQFIESMEALNV